MTKTTNINKHYTLRWNVDAIFLQPPILLQWNGFLLSRNNNEFHSSNWMYQVCSSLFVKCLMIKCKCPNVEIRTYNRNRKRPNCVWANICAVWIDHNHYNGMQSIQSAISLSNNILLLNRLTVISAQMHNQIKSVSSMRLTTRITRIWKQIPIKSSKCVKHSQCLCRRSVGDAISLFYEIWVIQGETSNSSGTPSK